MYKSVKKAISQQKHLGMEKQRAMKKVALHNLGCKVNSYEIEVMQQMLMEQGFEIVPFEEKADVYIVNTCSVTNIADRKSRQMLHKAKRENPEAIVIAAGCYAQTRPEEEILADGVDLIVGNNKKKDIVSIINQYFEGICQETKIDINHTNEYEQMTLTNTAEHTRAYIKVQDGCNQFCSYCIIPYARGRVRSRKRQEVLDEIKNLSEKGYCEFVLTGIHLSSYGLDTEDTLIDLIEAVHKLPGVRRIRLGSLEPRFVTEEIAKRMSGLEKLCPHFHLSLQSGCDATLARMNRHYTTNDYMEGVRYLRKYFQKPAITTDVIVGFPGETEEEFALTKEFLRKVEFYEMHVFKYSKRQGTRAAVMQAQVPEEVKTLRSNELLKMTAEDKRRFEEEIIGHTLEVLMEEETEVEGVRCQTGLSKEYVKVFWEQEGNYFGKIYQGRIVARNERGCLLFQPDEGQ